MYEILKATNKQINIHASNFNTIISKMLPQPTADELDGTELNYLKIKHREKLERERDRDRERREKKKKSEFNKINASENVRKKNCR